MADPDQMVTAPERARPVTWGMPDAAAGWLLGQLGGVITVSLVVALSSVDIGDTDELSLGWTALAQVGLWFGFVGVPWFVARVKGNGLRRDFGIYRERWDRLRGLAVGIGTQLAVLPLLYLPILWLTHTDDSELERAARELTDRATDPLGILVLVAIVGIGAPIAEEILYRGLVFRSIERRFGTCPGIVGSGVLFGVSHFQLLQLPGLTVFGCILAYLTHRTGRLVPAIYAHVAFNMVTVIYLVAD
jgi:membrane protease YdiL (CAAX protease family)